MSYEDSKGRQMNEIENNNSTPQIPEEKPAGKQERTKKDKSTPKVGRPPRETPEPPKWQIRGVERETRTVIEKAAKKKGQTIGEFFNTEIREHCTSIIKNKPEPPAAPQDIGNMVAAQLATMKTDLVADIVQQLTQQQNQEPERKGFFAKLGDLFR